MVCFERKDGLAEPWRTCGPISRIVGNRPLPKIPGSKIPFFRTWPYVRQNHQIWVTIRIPYCGVKIYFGSGLVTTGPLVPRSIS
jgi:hypothetical protein